MNNTFILCYHTQVRLDYLKKMVQQNTKQNTCHLLFFNLFTLFYD